MKATQFHHLKTPTSLLQLYSIKQTKKTDVKTTVHKNRGVTSCKAVGVWSSDILSMHQQNEGTAPFRRGNCIMLQHSTLGYGTEYTVIPLLSNVSKTGWSWEIRNISQGNFDSAPYVFTALGSCVCYFPIPSLLLEWNVDWHNYALSIRFQVNSWQKQLLCVS